MVVAEPTGAAMRTRTQAWVGVVAALMAAGLASPAGGTGGAAAVPGAAGGPTRVTGSATDRPAVIGRRVIGHSVRGRPLRAFHLGDPAASWTAVAIGAMHGDEQQTRLPLQHLLRHRPVDGVDLWVLPVLNPDGYRRGSRKNAHGVDLNRNFPVRWKDLDGDYESGPRPASEPETRATLRFLRRVDPDRMISLHQPLFNVDAKSSKRPLFSRRVARAMRIPIGNVDCGGVCHGTMTQWFNKRLHGASITVELSADPGRRYLSSIGPDGLLRAIGGRR